MPTAAVIGSTGATGSHILNTLLTTPAWTSITTISRRQPTPPSNIPTDKLTPILSSNLDEWPSLLPTSPPPSVVFSALGTTRVQTPSIEDRWKIDHHANVDLAKAAKKTGVKTFVFVSSVGTGSFPAKWFAYPRMKAGVENAIKEQDFDQAIILRPGTIFSERTGPRASEMSFQGLIKGVGKLGQGVMDMLGQEDHVIGTAAVRAVEAAERGEAPSKIWIMEGSDIIKYGRELEKETGKAGEAGA
ncbi:hypothetical protein MKZ38_001905 [Zalerion maritima]|uniref:NAD(P)-binding domain-containing protein n=1 Tax=Zalerion maritima TaxID=339359 RepID=A0AAD5RPQ0_9PEZI|nr:hypothetical protein MKZ38_001905 [Zalerion maritima]